MSRYGSRMTDQTGYPVTYRVGGAPQGQYQQYAPPPPHQQPTTTALQARLARIEVVVWVIATMGLITMCVVLYFLYDLIRFAEALQQAFPASGN